MGIYKPCVLGSDGNCTRWSHDHAADHPPVTDDARAVREAAMDLYRAMRRANPDAWAEIDEVEDWTYWDDIVRTAQVARAADRPTVTDQALAEAWAEGHRTGWEHCQDGNYGNDYWDDPTPNPYAATSAETTTGAIARGEALAAGDPDWMNVTRWPRTEAEATTTILRLIEDNRRMRHGSLCPECNAKAWGERADFRRERDELAARLAAVEALADRWRHCGDPGDPRRQAASALRAVLSAAPTDTTKETP